jgi:predicted hotdog family 3-hydroxylacyl-ACP dehydratase
MLKDKVPRGSTDEIIADWLPQLGPGCLIDRIVSGSVQFVRGEATQGPLFLRSFD